MRVRRILLSLSLVVWVLLVVAPSAAADHTQHSQHVAVTPVGDAQLHSGFVENIHANGPNVYAHENYHLNGAMPLTTYFVTLVAYAVVPGGQPAPGCGGTPAFYADDASFTTNAAGNGTAKSVIPPSVIDMLGLHDTTLVVQWMFSTGDFVDQGGTVAYLSDCVASRLD